MTRGPPEAPLEVLVEVPAADPSVCVILPKFILLKSATGFAKFV